MHNTTMTGSDQHAIEQPCVGCGKPLLLENAWMEDGCPCNTPAGVNNLNLYRWRLLHDLQQKDSRDLAAAQKQCEQEAIHASMLFDENNDLKAKLARIEAAGRELPEEPLFPEVDVWHQGHKRAKRVAMREDYDKLRTFAAAQTVRAQENERDAKRYRYWRERHTGKFVLLLPAGIFRFDYIAPAVDQMPRKAEAVDAAIDTAIKEQT